MTTTAVPTAARFAVATHNVPAAKGQGGDLSRADTRKAVRVPLEHAGLVGFQELSEAEDNTDLDTVLAQLDPGWQHFQAGSENDLAVSARWAPVINSAGKPRTHVTRLSDGKLHVSPNRDVTDVILEWTGAPAWSPFTFGSSHLVVVKADANLPWRNAARSEELDGLVDWVAAAAKVGNVILVLDSNWGRMPKLHPDWVWVGEGGNIDKCGYLNSPASNWTIGYAGEESYATPSDHPARVYNMTATYVPPNPWPVIGERITVTGTVRAVTPVPDQDAALVELDVAAPTDVTPA